MIVLAGFRTSGTYTAVYEVYNFNLVMYFQIFVHSFPFLPLYFSFYAYVSIILSLSHFFSFACSFSYFWFFSRKMVTEFAHLCYMIYRFNFYSEIRFQIYIRTSERITPYHRRGFQICGIEFNVLGLPLYGPEFIIM